MTDMRITCISWGSGPHLKLLPSFSPFYSSDRFKNSILYKKSVFNKKIYIFRYQNAFLHFTQKFTFESQKSVFNTKKCFTKFINSFLRKKKHISQN
jgi:hypothetical protein